jgi:hypothetical protein
MDTNSKYTENGRMTVQPVPISGLGHEIRNIFVGAFLKRIAITKLAVSGRRSVRVEQSGAHSFGFCEISYLDIYENCQNFPILVKI